MTATGAMQGPPAWTIAQFKTALAQLVTALRQSGVELPPGGQGLPPDAPTLDAVLHELVLHLQTAETAPEALPLQELAALAQTLADGLAPYTGTLPLASVLNAAQENHSPARLPGDTGSTTTLLAAKVSEPKSNVAPVASLQPGGLRALLEPIQGALASAGLLPPPANPGIALAAPGLQAAASALDVQATGIALQPGSGPAADSNRQNQNVAAGLAAVATGTQTVGTGALAVSAERAKGQSELPPSATQNSLGRPALVAGAALRGVTTPSGEVASRETGLAAAHSAPVPMKPVVASLAAIANPMRASLDEMPLQFTGRAFADVLQGAVAVPGGQANPVAASVQALAPAPMAAVFNTGVALPVLHGQWGQQLAQRIGWLTVQGIQSADIQLNPPELGPMQVRIDSSDNAAKVAITVHNPVTREALEAQLPRLRDLFAGQGLDLVDVDVDSGEHAPQQSSGEAAGEGDAEADGRAFTAPGAAEQGSDATPAAGQLASGDASSRTIVLHYAVDTYA